MRRRHSIREPKEGEIYHEDSLRDLIQPLAELERDAQRGPPADLNALTSPTPVTTALQQPPLADSSQSDDTSCLVMPW